MLSIKLSIMIFYESTNTLQITWSMSQSFAIGVLLFLVHISDLKNIIILNECIIFAPSFFQC